ncbi:hypothetical protein, partial [Halovibrio sp. HP20-50]|uniref:hypothetical protein n=1 Tax=Halovibrio sp. HP20-59 TaxID=3080275 RepID=UPI00294B5F98
GACGATFERAPRPDSDMDLIPIRSIRARDVTRRIRNLRREHVLIAAKLRAERRATNQRTGP